MEKETLNPNTHLSVYSQIEYLNIQKTVSKLQIRAYKKNIKNAQNERQKDLRLKVLQTAMKKVEMIDEEIKKISE